MEVNAVCVARILQTRVNLIFEFCVVIVQAGCTPRAWCVSLILGVHSGVIKKLKDLVGSTACT